MNNSLYLCFLLLLQMLSPQVPTLISHLGDQSLTEALLGALVDVSQASPSSLVSFLPTLRIVGQQCPALLGHVAKIHGAVGIISEVQRHIQAQIHTLWYKKREPSLGLSYSESMGKIDTFHHNFKRGYYAFPYFKNRIFLCTAWNEPFQKQHWNCTRCSHDLLKWCSY